MILWWDLDDLAKIRAANAAYAVLLTDAARSLQAKRLTLRWQRMTAKAAEAPEQFYAALLLCACDVATACWSYATAKAHLDAMRAMGLLE